MISVIIPVYNAEQHILNLVDCLNKQTYLEYEVILVDDGSIDDSGKICDCVCRADTRFRVIHQKNTGVSGARNNGMRAANGDFFTFIDADDEIPDNYLQVLGAEQRKTDADIVVCDVVIIEGEKEKNRFTHSKAVFDQREALNLLLTRRKINSGPCAKLFRSAVVRDVEFPKLKAYEDILFVKDSFVRAEKIVTTDRTEYRYIQNENSAMHQYIKMPSSDIIIATERLLEFIQKRKDLQPECLYITVSHLFQYVQLIKQVNNDESVAFIDKVRKLFMRYLVSILRNMAFPWKEKILYFGFCLGVIRW